MINLRQQNGVLFKVESMSISRRPASKYGFVQFFNIGTITSEELLLGDD